MTFSEPGNSLHFTLQSPNICDQCGTVLEKGTPVIYWHSQVGKAYDRIVSCPACTRPHTVFGERAWLLAQLDRLTVIQIPPEQATVATAQITEELTRNASRAANAMARIFDKLPRCEECQKYATHYIRHGPFFCLTHSTEYTTAQEVPWAAELRELGA